MLWLVGALKKIKEALNLLHALDARISDSGCCQKHAPR